MERNDKGAKECTAVEACPGGKGSEIIIKTNDGGEEVTSVDLLFCLPRPQTIQSLEKTESCLGGFILQTHCIRFLGLP